MDILALAHAPFLGHTGYANHSREFFTNLSKLMDVRVNNVTHVDDISYLKDEEHDIIIEQEFDGPPQKVGTPLGDCQYDEIVNIVLYTTNGQLFYREYDRPVIAYNVWESTRQPDQFFKRLLEFDQLWVPSQWQKICSVEQGYPIDRIRVVPEGVDLNIFKPNSRKKKGKFTFFLAGRWEHRKSVAEIIEQYVKNFGDNPDVCLILSADNKFSTDGFESVEDRLAHYGYDPEKYNIRVTRFMPFDEYLDTIQQCDCYLSCARSEGWNLPLMEAMACGVPTICSDYGAQLDFAKGIAHRVDIVDHLPPKEVYGYEEGECPGTWAEPDFDHLGHQMKYVYNNHAKCLIRAKAGSDEIRRDFNWERIVKKAKKYIEELVIKEESNIQTPNDEPKWMKVNFHFHDGAFLEVIGNTGDEYSYCLINRDDMKIEYEATLPENRWVRSGKKYFVNWRLEVRKENELILEHDLNLKGKTVMITFESSALGDTLAWLPYVEDFRVKHRCSIVISTFWNHIFNEAYPQFKFVNPGQTISDIHALYKIGVENGNFNWNKNDWRTVPIQQIAADILGVDYEEQKPRVNKYEYKKPEGRKIVAISEASTAGCKQWQFPGGWQEVVDYLNDRGYDVMVVSKERTNLKNIINRTSQPIRHTIQNILMADFFIGMSSGASWLAWALDVPVILISGCTKEWNEFQACKRIINKDVCNGCMNNPKHDFDKGDWWWCPEKQDMICTKSITSQMVIDAIEDMKQ